LFTHYAFILRKREKFKILNRYIFYDIKLNSFLLLSFYTEASVCSDIKVLLPHFFLRMTSLVSPISHFYQPCEHTAFTGRVSKEESFSKLVFYITLLQSYKFISHKNPSFGSSAITWRKTEIVQYFRGEITSL